jgi:hypothetical protein
MAVCGDQSGTAGSAREPALGAALAELRRRVDAASTSLATVEAEYRVLAEQAPWTGASPRDWPVTEAPRELARTSRPARPPMMTEFCEEIPHRPRRPRRRRRGPGRHLVTLVQLFGAVIALLWRQVQRASERARARAFEREEFEEFSLVERSAERPARRRRDAEDDREPVLAGGDDPLRRLRSLYPRY